MTRYRLGVIGIAVLLSGSGQGGGAGASAGDDAPVEAGRQHPDQEPADPQEPGRPPAQQRPSSAEMRERFMRHMRRFRESRNPAAPTTSGPPKYAMEVTGSRRVAGIYRSEVDFSNAEEGEIYFSVPIDLPRQTDVSATTEPAALRTTEPGRDRRPLFEIRLPEPGSTVPARVPVAVRYQATLLARRLVPLRPGQPIPAVPPLEPAEREANLARTFSLDYYTPAFEAWLEETSLRRKEGEDDLGFARRAFDTMRARFAYADHVPSAHASALCGLKALDCDTLSLVYVAALRANEVPARVLSGFSLESRRHTPEHPIEGHTQAEFYVTGVGWVPVDLANAIGHPEINPSHYFGQDDGTTLIVEVNPDIMLRHADGSLEHQISISPGPSMWAHSKSAKPSGKIHPLSWEAQVLSPPTRR